MAKELLLKLSNNNQHLNNIFNDNCYVELGNIDVTVFERIIKKELVSLSDVAYLPIQNTGIGHSNLNNSKMRNIMPYVINNCLFMFFLLILRK